MSQSSVPSTWGTLYYRIRSQGFCVGSDTFEPVHSSNRFSDILACLNLGPNATFGSSCSLDFEPNFGQVQRSSGSNQGSEPNYGTTTAHAWGYLGAALVASGASKYFGYAGLPVMECDIIYNIYDMTRSNTLYYRC